MGAAPRTTPGTCALQGGILLWGPFCPTLPSKALTPLKNPVFWAQPPGFDPAVPPSPVCRLLRPPRRCVPSFASVAQSLVFNSRGLFFSTSGELQVLCGRLRSSNKVVPDWLYCIFGGNQSEINRMLEMSKCHTSFLLRHAEEPHIVHCYKLHVKDS